MPHLFSHFTKSDCQASCAQAGSFVFILRGRKWVSVLEFVPHCCWVFKENQQEQHHNFRALNKRRATQMEVRALEHFARRHHAACGGPPPPPPRHFETKLAPFCRWLRAPPPVPPRPPPYILRRTHAKYHPHPQPKTRSEHLLLSL